MKNLRVRAVMVADLTLRRIHMFNVCRHTKITKTEVRGNNSYITFVRFRCPDCTMDCYRYQPKDDILHWIIWNPRNERELIEITAPQQAVGGGVCHHFNVTMREIQDPGDLTDSKMTTIYFKCSDCNFSGCFQYLPE